MTGDSGAALLAWWVVADIDDGGGRHFPAGSALWVLPPQRGDDGATVLVVGRRRGAPKQGYVRLRVPRRYLTAFRVRGLHDPGVLRRLTEQITLGWPARMWEGRDEAERAAALWNEVPGP